MNNKISGFIIILFLQCSITISIIVKMVVVGTVNFLKDINKKITSFVILFSIMRLTYHNCL